MEWINRNRSLLNKSLVAFLAVLILPTVFANTIPVLYCLFVPIRYSIMKYKELGYLGFAIKADYPKLFEKIKVGLGTMKNEHIAFLELYHSKALNQIKDSEIQYQIDQIKKYHRWSIYGFVMFGVLGLIVVLLAKGFSFE